MKKYFLCCLSLALLVLTGCGGRTFFDGHCSVNPEGWNDDEPVTLTVRIDDTTQFYNIFFDLRVTKNYPYANAFFFIDTRFPDGSFAADTLECPLADPTGRWYGKRGGRYVDNRYYFRRATRFPMTGIYSFEIRHAMRDTRMTGIKDVGIRFEKTTLQ